MEKQPSGPYSGDMVSFSGGGRRSGVGGGPLPGVLRRGGQEKPGRGRGCAAGSWASGKGRQSKKGQKSFWSRDRCGRGAPACTHAEAQTHTYRHIGMHRHAHAYRHMRTGPGTRSAAAREASTQRPERGQAGEDSPGSCKQTGRRVGPAHAGPCCASPSYLVPSQPSL